MCLSCRELVRTAESKHRRFALLGRLGPLSARLALGPRDGSATGEPRQLLFAWEGDF